jgi:hypothetical protein
VQWHHPRMLTEELQDPGITRIYTELMTHGGGNTYSMILPPKLDHLTAGSCQVLLGQNTALPSWPSTTKDSCTSARPGNSRYPAAPPSTTSPVTGSRRSTYKTEPSRHRLSLSVNRGRDNQRGNGYVRTSAGLPMRCPVRPSLPHVCIQPWPGAGSAA